jgi:hypothetical protein
MDMCLISFCCHREGKVNPGTDRPPQQVHSKRIFVRCITTRGAMLKKRTVVHAETVKRATKSLTQDENIPPMSIAPTATH